MDAFAALMGGRAAPRADGVDPNLLFYKGELSSEPNGAKVDQIHRSWRGDFRRLELHHGYIQWLFPVFENAGMNFESKPLSKEGAALIRKDPACARRVIKSYEMMLNFYGFKLADEKTGRIELDNEPEDRLDNLNCSAHNWLRVSRIITSLGELGFRRYKQPLIEALQRQVQNPQGIPNAARSCNDFWAPLVSGEGEPWYQRKTREDAADREESCIFQPGGELADGPAASSE